MRRVLALLVLCGCTEQSTLVGLVPDLPDSVTYLGVFVLSRSGALITSSPLLPRAETQPHTPLEVNEDAAELLVVGYEAGQLDPSRLPTPSVLSAAPLGFAGELEPPLPTPAFVVRGEPSTEVPLPAATLERALTASWARPCALNACERFRFGPLRIVLVPGESLAPASTTVVAADHQSLLFFNEGLNSPMYRFTPPDQVDVVTASIAGPAIREATTLADGRVAVLHDSGRISVREGDGRFEAWPRPSGAASARTFAASRYGDPLEVYFLDANSDVFVRTATAWRRSYDSDLESSDEQHMEWREPGEVLFIAPEIDQLVQVGPEGLQRGETLVSVRALRYIGGLGPVVSGGATQDALRPSLFVVEHDGLRSLETGILERAPASIWPTWRDGDLLFGGNNGDVSYYDEELGVCRFERYTSGGLRSAAMLAEGLVILPGRKSDNMYDGDTRLYFVPFDEPPRPACESAYAPVLNPQE